MTTFDLISAVVLLVALFGYLNYRFVRLPDAIGITAIGMLVSVAVILVGTFNPAFARQVKDIVAQINFPDTLLHGLLGMLLFAGSMHIRLDELRKEAWTILPLATIGVVLSTLLVGSGFYLVTQWVGIRVPFVFCLLFGALISPTDPIAVLAILRRVGVPKGLETRISGESLFNDGTGVAAFITLLGIAVDPAFTTVASTTILFVTEVAGGLGLGALVGYGGFLMLRTVDSYPTEILITLAMATAGYAAAEAAHVSAPIAVVVMGLVVGNRGKAEAMSSETRERLFNFWEVLDELLNLLLFGLIGLEMVTLSFSLQYAGIGLAAIAIVLGARLLSILGPVLATPRLRVVAHATLPIMTWGGLRGGISIALALSLPQFPGRDVVVVSTYAVVVFSILVQALTLEKIANWLLSSMQS